jgi:hypothetical protein
LLDYDKLDKRPQEAARNLAKAFKVAEEHLGIPVRFADMRVLVGFSAWDAS